MSASQPRTSSYRVAPLALHDLRRFLFVLLFGSPGSNSTRLDSAKAVRQRGGGGGGNATEGTQPSYGAGVSWTTPRINTRRPASHWPLLLEATPRPFSLFLVRSRFSLLSLLSLLSSILHLALRPPNRPEMTTTTDEGEAPKAATAPCRPSFARPTDFSLSADSSDLTFSARLFFFGPLASFLSRGIRSCPFLFLSTKNFWSCDHRSPRDFLADP